MASRGAWYPLINQGVQWDEKGNPFYFTSDSKRDYIPYGVAAQYRDDPKMIAWAASHGAYYRPDPNGGPSEYSAGNIPEGGVFHDRGTWNSEKGTYEQSLNWGNILSMVVGGALTAGVASALLGGGAAAQTAIDTAIATGSPEAGATAAGVTTATALPASTAAAAGGVLPSAATSGIASLAPGVAASGGVDAALAGGVTAGATGAGVGIGETGAVTGLPNVATGLPGATAAPAIKDLTTTDSGIPNVGGTGNTLEDIWGRTSDTGGIADLLKKILGPAAAGVSGALNSAGQTQLQNALIGLNANRDNIAGNLAYENELMNRAKEEGTQRNSALKDIYRNSAALNPRVSPFNPVGPRPMSDSYLSALSSLDTQGSEKLKKPAQYDTNFIAPLKPYEKYDPNTISGPGGTQQSTLQQIGNWTVPALSTLANLYRLFPSSTA